MSDTQEIQVEFEKQQITDSRPLIEQWITHNNLSVLDKNEVWEFQHEACQPSIQSQQEKFKKDHLLKWWVGKHAFPVVMIWVVSTFVSFLYNWISLIDSLNKIVFYGIIVIFSILEIFSCLWILQCEEEVDSLDGESWREENWKFSRIGFEYEGDLLKLFPCREVHSLDSRLFFIVMYHPDSDTRFLKIIDPHPQYGDQFYLDTWLKPKKEDGVQSPDSV